MLLHEEGEDEDDEESVKSSYLPVFHTSYDIFIQFFACTYFFTCSDVLRRQIEIENESKNYYPSVWL